MPKPTAHAETKRDPTDAAAALYLGEVMHARLKPIGHRFSYRVMSLLIDLDRLQAADRQSPLLGVNRAALYSSTRPIVTNATDRRCANMRSAARPNAASI